MPRKKKHNPDVSSEVDDMLGVISDMSPRNVKKSWNRKMDNMKKLLGELEPIEDKILELMHEKGKLFDRIQEIRKTMVKECIHPKEFLVYKEDHVLCKFCDRKISIPKNVKTDEA